MKISLVTVFQTAFGVTCFEIGLANTIKHPDTGFMLSGGLFMVGVFFLAVVGFKVKRAYQKQIADKNLILK